MKNLFLGILAITIAFSATAQNEKKNKKDIGNYSRQKFEGMQPGQSKLLTGNLNLTDDQKTKIKGFNESFKNQLKELNKNESITVKEQRERRNALTNEHRSSIKSVLTPAQIEQLKDERTGQGTPRLERSSGGDNQGKKIKEVNQEFRTKVQAVSKDDQLTDVQKRERVEDLQKQHKENIKAVLTEEQQNKLEAKKNRKNSK